MLDGIPVTRVNYELAEVLEYPRKRVQRIHSEVSENWILLSDHALCHYIVLVMEFLELKAS